MKTKNNSSDKWQTRIAVLSLLVSIIGVLVSFPTTQQLIDTNIVQRIVPMISNRPDNW